MFSTLLLTFSPRNAFVRPRLFHPDSTPILFFFFFNIIIVLASLSGRKFSMKKKFDKNSVRRIAKRNDGVWSSWPRVGGSRGWKRRRKLGIRCAMEKRKRNEAFRCFILRHFSSSGIARCSVVFLSRTKAGVIFVIFCKKKQKFYKL